MRIVVLFLMILAVMLQFGCGPSDSISTEQQGNLPSLDGETDILQSWQGDIPIAQLGLLPEDQHNTPIGFIDDSGTFRKVWKAFSPKEAVPSIDFKVHLVLFARNTQFYNRLSISKVKVHNGVAEVLAMETRSAIPIEGKVGMSLVVIAREGITSIQTGDKAVAVPSIQTY